MFRNYLVTAFRFLIKNQLFTTINVVGLAVSIASSMLIYLYVKNELTYDEFHADVDRLYIIGEGTKEGSEEEAAYYQTVLPMLPVMLDEFPDIESGTRYFDWEQHVLIDGDKKFIESVLYVDKTFLQVLSFPLLYGDPTTCLSQKDQVVISSPIAIKLFGSVDAVGKSIKFENEKIYSVSGVLAEVPENSSIRPDVLISLAEKEEDKQFMEMGNWYNTIAHAIVKVRDDANLSALRAKLPAFVKNHYDPAAKDRTLKIYPLANLRQSETENQTFIYGLATIGFLILLIAVFNFMNLAIASSLKRLKETGLRKVMGSGKRSILLQFFLEAALLTLCAIILSVGILQLCLPMVDKILNVSLELSTDHLLDLAILSAILILGIGFVAGAYPANYLSSFNTVSAVKGKIPNYRNRITLRNALVVAQFAVSIAMIVGVIVASRQIRFMKSADVKFNRDNVLVANLSLGYPDEKAARTKLRGIYNSLSERSDVATICLSQNVPGRYSESYNGYFSEDHAEPISLRQATVDEAYLALYGIKVVEGNNFSSSLSDTGRYVMINQAAADAFGWKNAVGKQIQGNGTKAKFTVIGVFDNFHYRSLEGDVQPLVHFYLRPRSIDNANYLSVKLIPSEAKDVISYLENEWKALDSYGSFSYFFVDEEFDNQYASVERTLILISFFALVAIIISCSGIFALSAIAAQQRTKEVGIRKVMGASMSDVVTLLSKDFIKLVAVAVLVAVPGAWYGMNQWLEDFAYKTDLEWWIFIVAGSAALIIAFITIASQSVKAALNNPVDSLRSE
ncbi:MAG TPA: ABC transporter permease [Chryseosolibacter sp.]